MTNSDDSFIVEKSDGSQIDLLYKPTKLSDLDNDGYDLEKIRKVSVSSNLTNQTTQISSGESETVIYVNSGTTTDYTIIVSSTYKTPDGNAIEITCPRNGYCEVSYINENGTIYARGL